jgi:fatty acid desaturase
MTTNRGKALGNATPSGSRGVVAARGPRLVATNRDYGELRGQVRAAGLLEPSYGYYAAMSVMVALGLAVGFALIALWPGPGDVLGVIVVAVMMVQAGFIGHDSGHNQIFRKSGNNRLAGLLAFSLVLGVSLEHWTHKHNLHHSRTNEAGIDPDITGQFIVFTPEQAARRRGVLGWIIRRQGTLYFLLATMASFGFRIDAWRHGLTNLGKSASRVEFAAIVANFVLWFVVPSVVFGPVRWLVLFLVVHMLVGVYMASAFAPNHKGMPLVVGKRPSFLRQQVLTSRNVHGPGAVGSAVVDFLYGGLNYQIEHHLFPTMPRNKLGATEPLVRRFCAEVGLPHLEQGVIASYRQLLGSLNSAGRGEEPEVIRG